MKISEVSDQCGLTVDTLRYYEKVGLLPSINRTNGGIREYNEVDIKRIDFIKCMRSAGLPIDVLLNYFVLVGQGDETIEERRNILEEQRIDLLAKMAELKETLNVLNYKIELYENALLEGEKAFAK